MSHHQNAGQNNIMKIANKPFENVEKFKQRSPTSRDQNNIHEEIKSRSNLENASAIQCRIFYLAVSYLRT
jgi:hypothetical protein